MYRRRFLQVNTRSKALDEIYKIYILLHRPDLKLSAKNRQHVFANGNRISVFSFLIFVSNFDFFCEFFMKIYPDFTTNSRKEWHVSRFQSNLRKQSGKLAKFLKSVKIIHYYSLLFIRVLTRDALPRGAAPDCLLYTSPSPRDRG